MQEAVQAAQVHEGAVVGQVLDGPAKDAALLEQLQGLALAGLLLDLDDGLAREDDVPPLLVHGDDLEIELFAAERLEVLDGLDVDERPGKEGLHADVDGEAALDPVDDAAADGRAGTVGPLDLVPDLHLLGLVLG